VEAGTPPRTVETGYKEENEQNVFAVKRTAMAILLQIDCLFQGPWGHEMSATMDGLAESIAQEPGLLWKIRESGVKT
jgi:hypothetical protein